MAKDEGFIGSYSFISVYKALGIMGVQKGVVVFLLLFVMDVCLLESAGFKVGFQGLGPTVDDIIPALP